MESILIIIPYFGKFNNFFPLFLKSIEYNDTIDFLIITDDKRKFDYPKNVKVIYSTFEEESKRITSYFPFEVKCDTPYKVAEYQPFYGEIYKEYAKDYDFWGWCETDLILGDIRHFVTSDLLKYCDKLYVHGHFSLIKNNGYVNDLLLNSPIYDDIWHCKEALPLPYNVHYDEYNGASPTLWRLGCKIYHNLSDLANIDFRYWTFYLSKYDEITEFIDEKLVFSFQKGKLLGITENLVKKEFLYVHFQKRNLENHVTNLDSFLIIPNSFLDYDSHFDLKKEFQRQSSLEKKEQKNYSKLIQKHINSKFTYYQPKQEVLEMLKKN